MKRTNSFIRAAAGAFLLMSALTAAGQGGTLRAYSMKSDILGVEKEFSVYLPEGYETSDSEYPVLYLLHGAGGYHGTWQEKGNLKMIADRVLAGGMAIPMIIVMPDARGEGDHRKYGGRNMGYFNCPEWRYEDHFFGEFIPHIEAAFRVMADKRHRAVAGLSMGGGGAAVYAQHRPDMFSSSCPLSGLLGMDDEELMRRLESSRYPDSFVMSAYKTQPVTFLENATEEQLAGLRSVRWYVDCGDDDYLWWGNIMFYKLMTEKNIPLQYRMRDGGHTWEYWQTALPTVLRFVSAGFAGM